MERTVVIIKPDGMKHKLMGKILSMYEENGLRVEDIYMCRADQDVLEEHYEEHINRDFYASLVKFMLEGPLCVILLAGENAVEVVREINGSTNPSKARPGTIRYLYGTSVQRNVVHGSASSEEAKREMEIWFDY